MTDKVSLALSAIAVATGILTYLQGREPGGKHRKRKRYRRGKRQR